MSHQAPPLLVAGETFPPPRRDDDPRYPGSVATVSTDPATGKPLDGDRARVAGDPDKERTGTADPGQNGVEPARVAGILAPARVKPG